MRCYVDAEHIPEVYCGKNKCCGQDIEMERKMTKRTKLEIPRKRHPFSLISKSVFLSFIYLVFSPKVQYGNYYWCCC